MELVKGCTELGDWTAATARVGVKYLFHRNTHISIFSYLYLYLGRHCVHVHVYVNIRVYLFIACSVFAVDSTFPFGQQWCSSVGGSLLIPLCPL